MLTGKIEIDVVIIGGGPSGSCAGAALARAGQRVRIIETSDFSKPRIGESLLPAGNQLLRHIGVWEKIEAAGFVRKQGAEFETPDGQHRVHNIFAQGLIPGGDYTYQVDRPRFDQLMLQHAIDSGCELDTQSTLAAAKVLPTHIELTTKAGETIRTQWLIDASGRQRFLGRHWKLPTDEISTPSRVATYNHFKHARRADGPASGNTIITRHQRGWFWHIPISEVLTSVGCVTLTSELRESKLRPAEWFARNVKQCPAVAQRLEQAQPQHDYTTTTDYSHMFRDFCGPRHFLVGDAATFTDPIFSSGVYLGLESAIQASEAILQSNGSLSPKAQASYTQSLKQQTAVVRELIDIFYSDSGFAVFMNPTDKFQLFSAINSIVGGNIKLNFSVRWRYALFKLICRLNRSYRLVPSVL